ncbi:MAG: TorF family putative porin [Rhodoferax sp.]|nr:TorF family putative porin [Rhodoferax sp.]
MKLKTASALTLAVLATLTGWGTALAQTATPAAPEAAAAPTPDYTLAYNVGVVTDYRYRGLSQSSKDPALQGGIDFTHKSGFYLGTWGSTIHWTQDDAKVYGLNPGATDSGSNHVEIDLYGGYKGQITKDLSYDVGLLQYWYPGNQYQNIVQSANVNTLEIYGALTYSLFTLKYSSSLTNIFGFVDSKNSGYVDLSANFDLGNGFSLTPHVGHQTIKNTETSDYTDYSLALNKDFGNGFSASASVVGTSTHAYVTSSGANKGGTGLVLGAKYTF